MGTVYTSSSVCGIQAHARQSPIFAIATLPAEGRDDPRSSALNVGDWVSKPLDMDHLVKILTKSIVRGCNAAARSSKASCVPYTFDRDGFYPIIIVYDREKRTKTAEEIREELRDLIVQEGITKEVIVGVPDRMIENWILADWETVSNQGKFKGNCPGTIEGKNGKSLICQFLPKGCYYHETIEGVDWFQRVRQQVLYNKSRSFRQFANALAAIKCEWCRAIVCNNL